MRNTWKKTAAFLLAFTLAAVPLSQTGAKDGLFGGRSIVAHAEEIYTTGSVDSSSLQVGDIVRKGVIINLTEEKGIQNVKWDGSSSVYARKANKTTTSFAYDVIVIDDSAKFANITVVNVKEIKTISSENITAKSDTVPVAASYKPSVQNKEGSEFFVITRDLTEDSDYVITSIKNSENQEITNVTSAGTYTVTIEGIGCFTGTATFTWTLNVAPTMTNASVTLNDGFGLNFYVDNITDATGYTVMFDGACDENGTEAALTEKDGKFFATANVNAKDIKENIAATLYKDGVATDVTLTSSVDAYLTAALATDGLDDKTKALIEATQLYGCTADNYFNNAENDFNQMFDDFLTYAGLESDPTPLYAAINNAVANDNVNDEKVSLVLNSKVKLRIYSDNGTNENNYGKYSEITGLTPLTMGQNQTVGGCSVSGYTWVDRVLEKNEIDKNYYMAMALASYMYAAEKYAIVDVASVAITNAPTEAITVGNTGTLTATVSPDNATNKTVTWAVTEGEDVLSINAATGAYTALKAGTAKVTATAGGKTDTCTVTVAPATITVTWNNDDITGTWGSSFTKDGVTITAGFIDFEDKNFMDGGTFTTTLGNFTKIEVTTGDWEASGTGWSGSTWAGTPASTVSFSGEIMGIGMGNTKFVFTIEPTN